ncbi:MAG TPA: hypothetical protein VJX67_04690 [Blastocatellia bacterium]|nr:hypothetical protein [Blastocatellia bacterium]
MAGCSNCGEEIGTGNFCGNCGKPVAPLSSNPSEEAATWRLPAKTSPDPIPRPSTTPVNQAPTGEGRNPAAPTGPAYIPPAPGYYAPAPMAKSPPAVRAGSDSIKIASWISEGWAVYRENWLLMSMASLLGGFLSVCTAGILAGPMLMGLFGMAFRTMRNERPQLGDLFSWEGRFLQALLAFVIIFVVTVAMGGGLGHSAGIFSPLGVVIDPFLTIGMLLTIPLILDARMDLAAAVNQVGRLICSRDAIKWWVAGLVFAVLQTLGLVGCGVGILVTFPWVVSSAAVAYRDVFGLDDPNRTLH